jgi:hypothetical protein
MRWMALVTAALSCVALGGTRTGGQPVSAQTTGKPHWVVVASPKSLPGLRTPAALAIDRRGFGKTKWMYTADTTTGRIYKFGTGGKYLARWQVTQPGSPAVRIAAGVAVGGNGNVFVTDPGRNVLDKFSSSGQRLAQWQPNATTGAFNTPQAVAVDANGNVYVGDRGNDRMVRFSPDGTVGASWTLPWPGGTGKSMPVAIAFELEGGLLEAGQCSDTACTQGHGDLPYAFIWSNSDGVTLGSMVGATPHGGQAKGDQPFVIITGVAGDRKDNRYVAGLIETPSRNPQPGVLEYTYKDKLIGSWTVPGTALPGGIAVAKDGTVYVTEGNRILRLVR